MARGGWEPWGLPIRVTEAWNPSPGVLTSQPFPRCAGAKMTTNGFRGCHFVCKFECKFAQQQPAPHRSGRTVLALQKRRFHAPAPMGPANRDANREPGASPRAKTPTVLEFSWGKNDYIFVRFWAIWGLYCGVATPWRRRTPRAALARRTARARERGSLAAREGE